jgi:hypothetical protein
MRRTLPQQDLFVPKPPRSDLSLAHRPKAIELLKILLTEAALKTAIESDTPASEGSGDD